MPELTESEVHLAEVNGSQWDGKGETVPSWPLSANQTHINAAPTMDDDGNVRDDGIVKTVEVSQKQLMRVDD